MLQLLDRPEDNDQSIESPRLLPTSHTPPRSPFKNGMIEDLPLPNLPMDDTEITVSSSTSTVSQEPRQEECSQEAEVTPVASEHQITAETVAVTGTPPPTA